MSHRSAVSIATSYGLDNRGVGSSIPGMLNNFHFCTSARPALGITQPPIECVLGVKLSVRETGHSPPTSVEDKFVRRHGVVLN
jgi:hypothetical protein